MKFIIGKKQEMTQIFKEDGTVVPVTKLIAGPCFVTDKKTIEKDGYVAIQVCFQEKNKKANKSLVGILKKALGVETNYQVVKEFRLDINDKMVEKINIGDKVTVDALLEGDLVGVQGFSKGKGFQGVVKRHGFNGGRKSHGNKDQLRMPGSIGATGPAHVFKGIRMAGHMGDQSVSIKNLEIVKIIPEENILFIKGAVPGARNSFLFLQADGEFEIAEKELVKNEVNAIDEKIEITAEKTATADNVTEKDEKSTENVPEVVATEKLNIDEKK